MPASPPPRKTAARKRPVKKVVLADPAGAPPLDAVDTPVDRPRKRTRNTRRRGATAPPGPDELVRQRQRVQVALELAAAGVSDWDELARLAGFADRSGAWRAVQTALGRQEFAAVADYRRLLGFRYERLIRANWEAAIATEESPAKDKATPRVLRAMEGIRRTFGLDLEIDKIADAFRIPDDPVEREQNLVAAIAGLNADLRLVVGDT